MSVHGFRQWLGSDAEIRKSEVDSAAWRQAMRGIRYGLFVVFGLSTGAVITSRAKINVGDSGNFGNSGDSQI